MTSESGDFQRRVWQGTQGTDIPLPRSEDTFTDTKSWNPAYRIPLLWFIVAQPLEHRGAILPVAPNNIIGRRGEVRWHDPRMSREHARVRLVRHPENPQEQIYAIEPLSDKSIFINGHELDNLTILLENDEIQMGDTLFIVKVLA